MRARLRVPAIIASVAATALFANAALAGSGQPSEWQMGFQGMVTDVGRHTDSFHHMLLWVIGLITLFVTVLLGYVIYRYSAHRNPTPARFTHNVVIEVLWTLVPVLILIPIAVNSISLLYEQEVVPENPDVTIKTIGNQWYWDYVYDIDGEPVVFSSVMMGGAASTYEMAKAKWDEDGVPAEDQPTRATWKLEVDEPIKVPVNKVVRMQVTAADVIHSWAIPAFGVKVDAVPGRLNETWFKADVIGTYYGQCSELCGKDHSYMPIRVDVVSEEDYAAWLERIHQEFASVDASTVKLAKAE